MGVVHLDVRSYFSLREGAFSPEDLATRAAELGMPAVALVDRDSLMGATRFVDACARAGVRPILGASVTMADGSSTILLARDDEGYANLCRIVTDAHAVPERGRPSLEVAQVCAHPRGLDCLLGVRSTAGRHARAGRARAARDAAAPYRDAFGDRLSIAVEHRLERDSPTEVRAMLATARALGARAVASNPVRYLVPGDAFLADALTCMRELAPIDARNVRRVNAEGWLKPDREMRALFAERSDLLRGAHEVAEACAFDLGLRRPRFPRFDPPPGRSATAVLVERCRAGAHRRGIVLTGPVADRLDHEVAMIHRLGYAAYFLTVADIVDDIRAMGISCACRGSAAGSLVCHLLGISDVDPIRHDLVFERFVNPLRDEAPDIDIDVESARREDVYDMILSRHDDDRSACVAMVETYRARAAIREVGKALGMPEVELGAVARAFPRIRAGAIRSAIDRLPELAGSNLGAGQLETLLRVCERLDGFPRHLALHPSGIVLSDERLPSRVPLERSARGYRMVQADKDDVELLGYLKLDVLGVRMLSAIRHCLDEVARTEDRKIDLGAIPDDDPATFALIRASDTLGCFQIESPGQRELLQKLQPERFEDLIVEISLFRPGPVKSDMIRPYLRRRQGWERPTYAHPDLRPALRETFGVIVYHEQVLRTLAAVAGYDLAEADRVRRLLGDEDALPSLRRAFLARAAWGGGGASRPRGAGGGPPAPARRVWDALAEFASFGFCKAHAAAFAVPTYRSAWLKTHHPAQFLAGVLAHEPGMYPRRLILQDARERGIAILPLDVNRSEADHRVEPTPDGGWGIRIPLGDVHGITDDEVARILLARIDGPFTGVEDLVARARVTRPTAEAIAHAGGFGDLGTGSRRDHLVAAMLAEPPADGEQLSLDVLPAVPTGFRDYGDAERVRAELEVLGVDVSRHLVSFFEPLLADLGATRACDLWRRRGGSRVLVAGVKVSTQTPAIRSGQRIIFLTLDDATGPVDVTVFESVQPRVARTVFDGYALAVAGTLRRTGVRGVSVVAEDVWDLTALAAARREGRLAEVMAEAAAPTPTTSRPPRRIWHASDGSAG